jgi:endonuclease/exonuclease/phosphatase family metal-dependent hydrolase
VIDPDPSAATWTVVTYNVHEWVGSDGRKDPERTLDVLGNLNADLIALQEVSFPQNDPAALTPDQLAGRLGLHPIPGVTFIKKDAEYGNLLLTRHRPAAVRLIDLSRDRREPRGAILAQWRIGEHLVTAAAAHLGLGGAERRRQIDILLSELTADRADVLILMGDLNEWRPHGPNLKRLKSIFGRQPYLRTYPARFPVLALDRIMVHADDGRVDRRVIRTPAAHRASDHLPLTAEVTVAPAGRARRGGESGDAWL